MKASHLSSKSRLPELEQRIQGDRGAGTRRGVVRILLALSIAIASSNAIPWAWDGIVTGKIASYDVVANGPNNFDLRIFLENGPALCTGGVNWAFINSTDPNYKTIATALISAKALGQQVTIYTAAYPYDTATFCKIGYITVS